MTTETDQSESEAGPRVEAGRQQLENSNVKETDAPLECPVGMQPC